jgi:hypothetical protein
MTRKEIEARIAFVEKQLAITRDVSTLAILNRCLEKLIMMDASDD